MKSKLISEDQIKEILDLINSRRIIQVKEILNSLPDSKNGRLSELEEFAKEVKRRVRSAGKSHSIPVSDFEDLFIKYSINIGKKT